jgi:formamidopyrimidine-DNA glycosylase
VPEGHTIHRYARLHHRMLAGRTVRAWSPQGRFADGARRLDGAVVGGVDAHGKHLFYRFRVDGADETLHVHLGLFGRFRTVNGHGPAPTPGTRLVLDSGDAQLRLSGPTACALIDPAQEQAVRARLGPDPLRDDDPARAFAALRRRTVGIGQALLDQRAVAGVGNVYRAEVLFLVGLHPDTPARAVDRDTFDQLWARLRALLADGERRGRIVTIEAADRTRPPSRLRRGERVYVYRRAGQPCRRCATTITSWELGGRPIYACPSCQPA